MYSRLVGRVLVILQVDAVCCALRDCLLLKLRGCWSKLVVRASCHGRGYWYALNPIGIQP